MLRRYRETGPRSVKQVRDSMRSRSKLCALLVQTAGESFCRQKGESGEPESREILAVPTQGTCGVFEPLLVQMLTESNLFGTG